MVHTARPELSLARFKFRHDDDRGHGSCPGEVACVSLLHPVHVIDPQKPGGKGFEIRPEKWWSPKSRREARQMAFVLRCLRHPAARDALEDSGNRAERRKAKVAPGQLERKPTARKR